MVEPLTKYPFYSLINSQNQAELALSVLTTYGSAKEKAILVPEVYKIQRDFMRSDGKSCLISAINNLLAAYLDMYGEFSDDLTIFLSKSLIQQRLALAS